MLFIALAKNYRFSVGKEEKEIKMANNVLTYEKSSETVFLF